MRRFVVLVCVAVSNFAYALNSNVSDLFKELPYESISGSGSEEIIEQIKRFSLDSYDILSIYSRTGPQDYFLDDRIPDVIKQELRSGNPWEQHVDIQIPTVIRPGSVAVDIGAHIGTHTVTMSRCVGPSGRVIAVEPQPKTFAELFLNMALNKVNNVQFIWGAMGSYIGKIGVPPICELNEGGSPVGGDQMVVVDIMPLDSLMLTNVSLIKIDVEGMEMEVLQGARDTILRNRPALLVEISVGVYYENATHEQRAEIDRRVKFVSDLGYNVHRIAGWDYLALPKQAPLKNKPPKRGRRDGGKGKY